MKVRVVPLFVYLAILVLASGCAMHQAPTQPLEFTPAAIPPGQYEAKVDNFQVILDASMTMGVRNQQGLETAKNFASALNQSLPANLSMNAGLRTFGHSDRQSAKLTEMVYGMTSYTPNGFQQGLDKIKFAGGTSPLARALTGAGEDLSPLAGKSAIIVVSDGLQMEDAPAAARAIKSKMGDNLCIYTVVIGDTDAGRRLLEQVAQASGCGFVVTAASLTTQPAMKQFVEQVFLTAKAAPAVVDSDGDGVPDHLDRCPDTPAGVEVDEFGCPIDSDGDGVPDYLDRCPDTPKGVMVDEHGCEIKFTLNIRFDTNQAVVQPRYHDELAKAAEFTREHPELQVLVAGHTDSTGNAEYNKELSERRAQAVKDYLVEHFGADAEQLQVRGYGIERPVADNATAEGRQLNRRVELLYIQGVTD